MDTSTYYLLLCSYQGKKEVACIVTKSLVSCLCGCGESVNPSKLNIQEVQGALPADPASYSLGEVYIAIAGHFFQWSAGHCEIVVYHMHEHSLKSDFSWYFQSKDLHIMCPLANINITTTITVAEIYPIMLLQSTGGSGSTSKAQNPCTCIHRLRPWISALWLKSAFMLRAIPIKILMQSKT